MQSKGCQINGVQSNKQTAEKAKKILGGQKLQQKGETRNGNHENIKNEVKRPMKWEAVDVEIENMAKKLRLANEKKMAQLNVFSTTLNAAQASQKVNSEETKSEDWTSVQGQFGWAEVANTAIPYLIRSGEKYVSLRMADNRVLAKYKNVFTDEVRSCFSAKILHATAKEAQLLNEINFRHCDNFYGRLEFSMRDGIIRLKDVCETYDFLNFCHLRLIERISVPQNRCGFIKIAAQNCVPYTWHENKRYVPLFYFEGECKYLEERSIPLSGWDLAYLKLYCKVQGIRKTLYEGESIRVVEVELVKKFFPPDTLFEENWPDDYNIDGLVLKPTHKVLLSQNNNVAAPQKKQWALAPKQPSNPTPTTVVVNSQPPTAPITCLNGSLKALPVPPLRIYSNQNLQRPRTNGIPQPPRTTACSVVPNITNPQKTVSTNKPTPAVTILNNLAYRQSFLAKPLVLPSTYQRGSRMLQIPEVTCNNAYFVLRTQVEDKVFQWCINLEPFMTTILLVTLEETATFFQLPLDLVVNAVNVMNIDIFLPNGMQKRMLEKFKVCQTRGLLKLREFNDNLPQLRYILDKTKTFD